MNVLVTGGAGYIGLNVCAELYKKAHKPIIYDNFSSHSNHSLESLYTFALPVMWLALSINTFCLLIDVCNILLMHIL